MSNQFRAGRVAIVGRPNTGKSTLLNALVGIKISSVSHRVQTTRHSIMGVYQDKNTRIDFLDTPGFQLAHKTLLNKFMNKVISNNLKEVDVILMLIDADRFSSSDRVILDMLPEGTPVLLGVNKIDKLVNRDLLLPFINKVKLEYNFREIVPLSGLKKDNFPALIKTIGRFLPFIEGGDENYDVTDRTESFLASEIIREKLYYRIDKEIPYNSTVIIDKFVESNGLKSISATVIVGRLNHKAIVIGKKGEQLKIIASEARRDMEKLFDSKVFLQIWVKVNTGWVNDENALKSLGYQLS